VEAEAGVGGVNSATQIDWLVLTAANEAQARGYRAQLKARERDGRLKAVRRWLVVPDPGNRRVGSGGSTLIVLSELARRLRRQDPRARGIARLFEGKRILLIHSGGDSRRLPAYAAEGKVFVPLPGTTADGHSSTLFDLVLEDLAAVAELGRVTIAAGDVLLGIGKHAPDLTARGMVGVAFAGAMEVGSRHGVYLGGRSGRVAGFLQKPDRATALKHDALDSHGRVLIDTGVLSLDAKAAASWLRAGARYLKQVELGVPGHIDLYSDILPRLANGAVIRDSVVASRGSDTVRGISEGLWEVPFHVAVVPRCDFVHIGSTRELLRVVGSGWGSGGGKLTRFNGVVSSRIASTGCAIVEASRIDRPVRLGRDSVLVGFPGGFSLWIGDRRGMCFVPVGPVQWACIVFGVDDDFKTPWTRGGTIGNEPIRSWLNPVGLAAAEVLQHGDGSLWWARVWPVGSFDHVVRASRWMARPGAAPSQAWRVSHRMSMAELMPRVNVRRLMKQREELRAASDVSRAVTDIMRSSTLPAASLVRRVPSRQAAAELGAAICARVSREKDPLVRARLYRLGAALNTRFAGVASVSAGTDLDALAFASIAEGVAAVSKYSPVRASAAIALGSVVRVTCPVRIDLAGGWSDTPPICHEMGGTVVNAAITLDGRQPVEVSARLIQETVLRLRSEDLNQSTSISDTASARAHHDPQDWAALPKAALMLAGITPRAAKASLSRRLREFGGGLELTMSVAVPKGSGLGTSSILGAAVLAALDRVCGKTWSTRSLIERTSVLEQMMSTAGGWQDQAGGITPGIKILRTLPGGNQVPSVRPLKPRPSFLHALQKRGLLYYTGRRRLARDILRGVVGRYLSGDPGVVTIVQELKSAAACMAKNIASGDMDGFARGVSRNWELKKAIDPGATDARIEAILSPIVPHLSGYELPGAGGGGFIFMIARSAGDARAVRTLLERRRTKGAGFFEFALDRTGLTVSVERSDA
jgi:fucokinase